MVPVLRPVPDLRVRVWGGTRLGAPTAAGPIGEAWVAGPTSRLPGPPGAAGPTLDELASRLGRELVGRASPWPDRFPLLVKLVDTAEWLSVQVHPDDATARRLAGPGAVGKTEAWFVLDAAPGAELLVGIRAGVPAEQVRAAIGGGGLTALLERVAPSPGDTILVPAGTLHAVGPGVFLYELQQPSDLTYRADDWGRPATPQRPLHVDETLASWDPSTAPLMARPPAGPLVPRHELVECRQFVMELLAPGDGLMARGPGDGGPDAIAPGAVALDPGGVTPHVLTALARSRVVVEGAGWREELGPLESIVVAASAGPYRVAAAGSGAAGSGPAIALLARLPG